MVAILRELFGRFCEEIPMSLILEIEFHSQFSLSHMHDFPCGDCACDCAQSCKDVEEQCNILIVVVETVAFLLYLVDMGTGFVCYRRHPLAASVEAWHDALCDSTVDCAVEISG